MNIVQMPVQNHWNGAFKKVAIVNHCMGRDTHGNLGTLEGTYSWFSNPDSQVSSNFGIARDGRIWQFVASNQPAWANGTVEKPDLSIKWLAEAVAAGVNPNNLTISIEHEGDGVLPMPESQYQATLWLHRLLVMAFNIPRDAEHIIRHSQISSIQKANCPGVSFPMARLLKEVAGVDNSFTDPVTNIPVAAQFADFYLAKGGLPIFGRPLAVARPARGQFGAAIAVQWFERARFELQLNNSIVLGLVGREALQCSPLQ